MTRMLLIASSLALVTACEEQPTSTPQPDRTTVAAPTQTSPVATAKPGADDAGAKAKATGDVLVDPGAEEPQKVKKAMVVLHPLGDGKTKGTVEIEEVDGSLKIKTSVEGLPAGKHAHHVHLLGDCSGADGKTAGTHFHFDGPSKNPPEDIKIITGDLGDLEAGPDGKATHEATIEGASLQGPFSILGRSIIIHEKPNDPKDPPIGGAGGRIACGVIGIAE